MSNFQAAKFDNTVEKEFLTTLRKRVMGYFKENNTPKEANANMVMKSIFMVTLFTTPYVLMIAGFIQNPWMVFFMYILMGFGMTGIGLCIRHDATHGAYSKNPKVNKYMGLLL
ncbi:MAG: acyl-CoA desaturase, partial [Flavobacteriales bacterium]|nr:acyl-CoA desaturase [Flavobacteriales bacterium]